MAKQREGGFKSGSSLLFANKMDNMPKRKKNCAIFCARLSIFIDISVFKERWIGLGVDQERIFGNDLKNLL